MSFGLFFLGEYGNMILMSSMSTILSWWMVASCAKNEFLSLIPGFVWFLLKVALFIIYVSLGESNFTKVSV